MRGVAAHATALSGEVLERDAGPTPGLWMWHESVAPDGPDVIVWFHGGAYVSGQPDQIRAMGTALSAATGARVFAPAYRLAPEHPAPAALDDAVAAYRAVLALAAPEHLVVGGDSAGGGVALAALLALRDLGDPLPAGAVTFSAWTDLALTGDSLETRKEFFFGSSEPFMRRCADAYLGAADPFDPRVSPLYGDWRGMPPLHVQVGDHDPLLADSTRLAERARGAGVAVDLVVWPEMPHVHQGLAGVAPEADEAVDRAAAFIRARLATVATGRADVGHV